MYVMQMIKQNPKYGPVIQVLQRYNGDSMKAFREIASQNGFNPDFEQKHSLNMNEKNKKGR